MSHIIDDWEKRLAAHLPALTKKERQWRSLQALKRKQEQLTRDEERLESEYSTLEDRIASLEAWREEQMR